MSEITLFKYRFLTNSHRHPDISWEDVEARLIAHPEKFAILEKMEETGGEPDIVWHDIDTGEYIWMDCSAESPTGRRSLCYDRAALDARKENKPKSSVEEMAKEIGIELLTESDYRYLQTLGDFDMKTSSWIATPETIRKLGGALFCDLRYDTVFTYHNGADSYYAARGWRGKVRI
jgi:Protein of unknown function (DUF4256)